MNSKLPENLIEVLFGTKMEGREHNVYLTWAAAVVRTGAMLPCSPPGPPHLLLSLNFWVSTSYVLQCTNISMHVYIWYIFSVVGHTILRSTRSYYTPSRTNENWITSYKIIWNKWNNNCKKLQSKLIIYIVLYFI